MRLPVRRTRARALLGSQLADGRELRRAIARAATSAELAAVDARLTAWSARNGRLLSRIFGATDRRAYLAACRAPSDVDSVHRHQDAREQHALAGLEYLRDALGRLDPVSGKSVPQTTSSAGSLWRTTLKNPWVIGVGTTVIAAAVISLSGWAFSAVRHHSSMIAGTVVCLSGRRVVGVWIAASSGQQASGYPHLGPHDVTGVSYPAGSTATYSFSLVGGGSYAVHVGCGGSAKDWASSNYSPLLSRPGVFLRCHDPLRSETPGQSPRGACQVSAGP